MNAGAALISGFSKQGSCALATVYSVQSNKSICGEPFVLPELCCSKSIGIPSDSIHLKCLSVELLVTRSDGWADGW